MKKWTAEAEQRFPGSDTETLFLRYDIIRQAVSCVDVARAVGLQPDAHGRCRCIFHNGQDRNMKVYPGDRGYYCFVCHAHGDCIRLAKQALGEGSTYTQAARWIDDTFGLNVFEKKQPTLRERIRRAEMQKRNGRQTL